MDIVSGVVVYILLWWWVLFMVLPFGAKAPKRVGEGHATSAPARPRMALKLAITTGLSAVLFIIVYFIITSGIFSFRDFAGSSMRRTDLTLYISNTTSSEDGRSVDGWNISRHLI